MKKLFLIGVAIVGFTLATLAQPRAIGGRLGWSLEGSYQHGIGNSNYFQIDAGLIGYIFGIQATGTYNWIFATPDWTNGWGKWEWFGGVGAGTGFNWSSNAPFFTGAAGNIGLSFTFPFNLQLSVDYRPTIGVCFGKHQDGRKNPVYAEFYPLGLYEGGLSVRYAF